MAGKRVLGRIPEGLEYQDKEFGVSSLDTEKFLSWGMNREAVLWDH